MNHMYDDDAFFKAYAKMQRSEKGLESAGEWRQLRRLFPDLVGKKVLDLGCGYGWHCKYAVEHGAGFVQGIDCSEKMIAAAREKNADPKIVYSVCALDDFDYPSNLYDFVISNLVLHYIEDLQGIYKKVYQALRANGVFLLNIEHPVFTGSVNQDWIYDQEGNALYWPVDNYFYPGMRETHFLGQTVIKQHHTITQILNGLLQCGFRIQAVEEAMPPQTILEDSEMQDEMRRPMMLLVKTKKCVEG